MTKLFCTVCGRRMVDYVPQDGGSGYSWVACPIYASQWRRLYRDGRQHDLVRSRPIEPRFNRETGERLR